MSWIAVIGQWFLYLPVLVGYGSLLNLAFPRLKGHLALPTLGLLGVGALGMVAVALNLVTALDATAASVLALAGFALFALEARSRALSSRRVFLRELGLSIAIFCLVWPWVTAPVPAYDTGLYHLPAIRWAQAEPVALGIANLHGRLAFNSLLFPLVASVSFSASSLVAAFSLNPAVLALAFADLVLQVARARTEGWKAGTCCAAVILALLVIPSFIPALAPSGPGTDLSAAVLLMLSSQRALMLRRNGDDDAAVALTSLLFALVASLIKVSCLAYLLLLVAWIIARTSYGREWRLALKDLSVACALCVPWVIRGVLQSGCLVYPLGATCLPLSWRVPAVRVRGMNDAIIGWARSPHDDYLEAAHHFHWLAAWWSDFCADQVVRLTAAMVLIGCTFAVGALFFAKARRDSSLPNTVEVAFMHVATLLLWFFQAPSVRFALGSFLALGAVVLSLGLTPWLSATGTRFARGVPVAIVAVVLLLVGARSAKALLRANTTLVGLTLPSPTLNLMQRDGESVVTPVGDDRCWDSQLLCAVAVDPSLRIGRASDQRHYFQSR